jgi:alpha-galactosidase
MERKKTQMEKKTQKTDPNVTVTNTKPNETVIVVPSKRLVKVILYRNRCPSGCCGKDQFVGTARCMETDIFNEELGTNLARIRAKRKVVLVRVREFNQDTEEIMARYTEKMNKQFSIRKRLMKDFSALDKEENILLGHGEYRSCGR